MALVTSRLSSSVLPGTDDAIDLLFAGSPLHVGVSKLGGRGVFASRDIAAGERVLSADAAAVCLEVRSRQALCYRCLAFHRPADPEFTLCCGCGIAAYCSEACAVADGRRHGFECEALARLEGAKLPKGEALLARLLCGFVANALDAAEDASCATLACLLELARDNAKVPQFQRRQKQRRAAVSRFLAAVKDLPLGACAFRADELEGALEAVPLTEFGLFDEDGETCGVAIVPAVAMANHACTPNVARRFEGGSCRTMCLYALHSILAGTEICHSYVERDQPAEERRAALQTTWGIPCTCLRCLGPSAADPRRSAGAVAKLADFDARYGCPCGAFRPNIATAEAEGNTECWCLAVQMRRESPAQQSAS
eukprot:TRINITY_DN68656_c0_g1_i1.p1 TRINITY_DN68656_c0_g1~~TRINITY_DN68656_c0_g1_i1.p1  ORF type:complete len:368 (-),score=64.17 TRINITY_DN68656_c0_g1_i1:209-1312(-)